MVPPVYEVVSLTKRFRDRTVLDHLSLSIRGGEIALLLGRSGSGKSTLLRLLSGLEQADSGKLLFNGEPMERSTVGLVFQEYHLFDHLNTLENLVLPLTCVTSLARPQARRAAMELLDRFELTSRANALPSQLSGGERQRLAIARAIAVKPSLLCMDEPTSALDPTTTQMVSDEIRRLASEGYGLLIATHHIDLIWQLECTVHLLDGGRLIASCPSSAIESHPEIKEYLNPMGSRATPAASRSQSQCAAQEFGTSRQSQLEPKLALHR